MTIGLVILGIVAVLIFFGAAERYFEMLGLTSWLTFLIILAFVLGAVIPDIEIGSVSIGIGGFIIPLIVSVILISLTRRSTNAWRLLPAVALTAFITAGLRLLFRPESAEMILTSSLVAGFACGALAFVITDSRISILIASIAGITLGDIIGSSVLFAIADGKVLYFGAYGTFDSLMIACAFGLVLYEAVAALKKVRISKAARLNLNTEAAEDMAIGVKEGEKIMKSGEKTADTGEGGEETPDAKKILDYLDD